MKMKTWKFVTVLTFVGLSVAGCDAIGRGTSDGISEGIAGALSALIINLLAPVAGG